MTVAITDYTPEDLIAAARKLLVREDAQASGVWPRAAAHLLRQALEQSLEDFWRARAPVLVGSPMRVQLLALPTLLKDAESAAYTWGALSNACHHHPYELAPSDVELRDWIGGVEALQKAIGTALR